MGLFGFLKKDKIENENKSKPFYKNENNSERKDWFSRTRPWHKVDPKIIDALIEKYNDDPMFQVFIQASRENGLIKEYEDIGFKGIDGEVACSVISGILVKHGGRASANAGKLFSHGKVNKLLSSFYKNGMNLLESAIILDPNQVNAYIQLAGLRGMLNKNADALSYVQQGLCVIEKIKESDIPFHESSNPEIQNTAQYLDDAKDILLVMERDFS